MDAATLKILIDAGSFGLLAYLVIWGGPRLLARLDAHGDKRDATFRAEMAAEREFHQRERTTDRDAFTTSIDRMAEAVDENTKETRELVSVLRGNHSTIRKS